MGLGNWFSGENTDNENYTGGFGNWFGNSDSSSTDTQTNTVPPDFGSLEDYYSNPNGGYADTQVQNPTPTVWDNVSSIAKTGANNVGGWLSNPNYSVTSPGEQGGLSPSNLFKGGLGLYDYSQKRRALNSAENTYNQYNDQARQYATQLANLQANPDSFKNNPSYIAAEKQAREAARRQAAASGMLGSSGGINNIGRASANTANTFYNQEANRLASLGAMNSTAANNAASARAAKSDQLTGAYTQYAKMFGLI